MPASLNAFTHPADIKVLRVVELGVGGLADFVAAELVGVEADEGPETVGFPLLQQIVFGRGRRVMLRKIDAVDLLGTAR